jgi:hypothetical protein
MGKQRNLADEEQVISCFLALAQQPHLSQPPIAHDPIRHVQRRRRFVDALPDEEHEQVADGIGTTLIPQST